MNKLKLILLLLAGFGVINNAIAGDSSESSSSDSEPITSSSSDNISDSWDNYSIENMNSSTPRFEGTQDQQEIARLVWQARQNAIKRNNELEDEDKDNLNLINSFYDISADALLKLKKQKDDTAIFQQRLAAVVMRARNNGELKNTIIPEGVSELAKMVNLEHLGENYSVETMNSDTPVFNICLTKKERRILMQVWETFKIIRERNDKINEINDLADSFVFLETDPTKTSQEITEAARKKLDEIIARDQENGGLQYIKKPAINLSGNKNNSTKNKKEQRRAAAQRMQKRRSESEVESDADNKHTALLRKQKTGSKVRFQEPANSSKVDPKSKGNQEQKFIDPSLDPDTRIVVDDTQAEEVVRSFTDTETDNDEGYVSPNDNPNIENIARPNSSSRSLPAANHVTVENLTDKDKVKGVTQKSLYEFRKEREALIGGQSLKDYLADLNKARQNPEMQEAKKRCDAKKAARNNCQNAASSSTQSQVGVKKNENDKVDANQITDPIALARIRRQERKKEADSSMNILTAETASSSSQGQSFGQVDGNDADSSSSSSSNEDDASGNNAIDPQQTTPLPDANNNAKSSGNAQPKDKDKGKDKLVIDLEKQDRSDSDVHIDVSNVAGPSGTSNLPINQPDAKTEYAKQVAAALGSKKGLATVLITAFLGAAAFGAQRYLNGTNQEEEEGFSESDQEYESDEQNAEENYSEEEEDESAIISIKKIKEEYPEYFDAEKNPEIRNYAACNRSSTPANELAKLLGIEDVYERCLWVKDQKSTNFLEIFTNEAFIIEAKNLAAVALIIAEKE